MTPAIELVILIRIKIVLLFITQHVVLMLIPYKLIVVNMESVKRQKVIFNHDILTKISIKVKYERNKLNLSQEKFALACGLSRNYIGLLERKEIQPTIVAVEKIAKYLNKDLAEFFSGL